MIPDKTYKGQGCLHGLNRYQVICMALHVLNEGLYRDEFHDTNYLAPRFHWLVT